MDGVTRQLTGLLAPSRYAYSDHPDRITVNRHDLEVCLRATISTAMLEGGDIAVLTCDCMEALDKMSQ